ncbi:MAG: sigma-70 family RNA polymerase sigma factor [Planctomycetota bacterium]
MRDSLVTADLVRAAQAGDKAALEQLFARYYDRVRRVVGIRMGPRVRSWTDSVDIMTRTMLKAAEKLGTFEMRDDTALLKWLLTIAEGMVRDAVDERNAARRNPDRETEANSTVKVPTPSVGSLLARDEDGAMVDRAIAALSDSDRDLLVRHYFLGQSWQQIGAETGDVGEAAVRRRASIARARLAIELQRLRRSPPPEERTAH